MTRFHTLNLFAILAMTLLSAPTIHAAHVTEVAVEPSANGAFFIRNTATTYTVAMNTNIRLKMRLKKHFTEAGYRVEATSSHPDIISGFIESKQTPPAGASYSFSKTLSVNTITTFGTRPTQVTLTFDAGFIAAGFSNQPSSIRINVIPPPPTETPTFVTRPALRHDLSSVDFVLPPRASTVRCRVTGPGLPDEGRELESSGSGFFGVRVSCYLQLPTARPGVTYCEDYTLTAKACNARGCATIAPAQHTFIFGYSVGAPSSFSCADASSQGAQQGFQPRLGDLHKKPKPGTVDQNILVPQSKKYGNQPPQWNYPLYDPKAQKALPKK